MNETKFTKGPWFTDPDQDLSACEPRVYAQGPEPLFELDVTIAIVTAYHARLSREEAKANAALISAAPEMAELLLEILGEIELDEIPVKDRPSSFLKIVKVLGKAGINVMERKDAN